jgi:hypothetical protein
MLWWMGNIERSTLENGTFRTADEDRAVLVPAGVWHNVIDIGTEDPTARSRP